MSFLANDARATKVWFDDDNMWVSLADGRTLSVPKAWFPRLLDASNADLENYEFSGHGLGVHWDALDEDIYVPNLLTGMSARSSPAQQTA